jgi:hypothetical protein
MEASLSDTRYRRWCLRRLQGWGFPLQPSGSGPVLQTLDYQESDRGYHQTIKNSDGAQDRRTQGTSSFLPFMGTLTLYRELDQFDLASKSVCRTSMMHSVPQTPGYKSRCHSFHCSFKAFNRFSASASSFSIPWCIVDFRFVANRRRKRDAGSRSQLHSSAWRTLNFWLQPSQNDAGEPENFRTQVRASDWAESSSAAGVKQ